jgi:CheY-like chemotaxis protein
MSEKNKFNLLLIESDKEFTQTAQRYGELSGWLVEAPESLEDWEVTDCRPDLVLLDFGLDDNRAHNWARKLKQADLLKRTWLLSAQHSTERGKFIQEWGLNGFLRKPVDLARLPTIAESSAQQIQPSLSGSDATLSFPLDQLANQLIPAIDIIDCATLESIWSNRVASVSTLSSHDRKILRLLDSELYSNKKLSSAQRLDWDNEQERFRHTRLYRLKDHYWLTRDWRTEGESVHDADFFDFENYPDLEKRLAAVAMYMAKRYGITRLCLYKVAELPRASFDNSNFPSPLVMPLFERGGGLVPDADTWRFSAFLVDENHSTKELLESANGILLKEAPTRVEEEGDKSKAKFKCDTVDFGPQGTARALFAIKGKGQNSQTRAILELDRRLDAKYVDALDTQDRELALVAYQVAGVFDGPLTGEELQAMTGQLDDLGTRILRWIEYDESARESEWHKRISILWHSALVEQERTRDAEPFDRLSMVCAKLREEWKNPDTTGRVWGLLPDDKLNCEGQFTECGDQPDPISDWYLALNLGQDQWQAVAGNGSTYERYREHNSPIEMLAPHKESFQADPWKSQVIQDFSAWFKKNCSDTSEDFSKSCLWVRQSPEKIGAWLAIPMELEGHLKALMVVHSPYRFHFTALRCSLLESAARRLLPPFSSAVAESRIRGAFAAAVMHEVKNDAATAILHCERLEKEIIRLPVERSAVLEEITMLRHYLEGLNELGRDFLDILRPSSDDPSRGDGDLACEIEQVQTVKIADWFENQLKPWRWLYGDLRKIDLNNISGDGSSVSGQIILCAPILLKRVFRVLLQNAFRHGEICVLIEWKISGSETADCAAESWLELAITNPAYESVAMSLKGGVNSASSQIGPSAQARARVGLTNANRLTRSIGGKLTLDVVDDESISKDGSIGDEAMKKVSTHLRWPLSLDEIK